MSTEQFVPYSDSVEIEQPNEADDTRDVLASFDRLRRYTFDKHRHGLRDAHAKSHGIVVGTLTVHDDLPTSLAQGLFSAVRTYPVVVRFSTAPGDILPDGVAAFRGMSIKVIGAEGPKILPEFADAVTQDFLFINHPAIPTGDVSSYLKAQTRLEKLAHAPEEVQEALTTVARVGGSLLHKVGVDAAGVIGQGMAETHILGETFFTSAPLRYGDHIARLSVVPASGNLQPLRGQKIDTRNDSALRDLVVDFFRNGAAEYDVRAQLCTDLERMPVEDASVRWPEDESPYRSIATLSLPAQDAYSAARRVYADDVLSFNPWHTLVEHRPLGSIMRVRRGAYDASSRDRHERNARPRIEPRSIDEVPQ